MPEKTRLEEIGELLARAFKPMPKLKATLAVTQTIEERFGADGDGWPDAFMLEKLYDRLVAEGYHHRYSTREKRHIPRLMFSGVDLERRALFDNRRVFSSWIAAMADMSEREHRDRIVRMFYSSECAVKTDEASFQIFIDTIGPLESQAHLRQIGLLREKSIDAFARRISEHDLVTKTVPRLSEGWVKADSAFCREVWLKTLPRIKENVIRTWKHPAAFAAFLADVKDDVLLPTNVFRWPTREVVEGLASAILDPFMPGENRLPGPEQIDTLRKFWILLFGEPEDTRNNQRWYGVHDKYRKLVAHWASGRRLIASLDFLRRYTALQAERWSEREAFLRSYWNAGRVIDCKIYVREQDARLFGQKKLIAEFSGTCDISTNLESSSTKNHAVMLVKMEDRILLAEVNYNGCFHAGYDAKTPLPKHRSGRDWRTPHDSLDFNRSRIDYTPDIVYFGTSIIHKGPWEQKAHTAIADLSGRVSPISAMG